MPVHRLNHAMTVLARGFFLNLLDVREWHKLWSDNGRAPAAGRMAFAVLKAAIRFACASGYEQCRRLRTSLDEDITLPSIKPRTAFVTAGGVDTLRKVAHA